MELVRWSGLFVLICADCFQMNDYQWSYFSHDLMFSFRRCSNGLCEIPFRLLKSWAAIGTRSLHMEWQETWTNQGNTQSSKRYLSWIWCQLWFSWRPIDYCLANVSVLFHHVFVSVCSLTCSWEQSQLHASPGRPWLSSHCFVFSHGFLSQSQNLHGLPWRW